MAKVVFISGASFGLTGATVRDDRSSDGRLYSFS